jgi:hypothetical protein
MKKTLVFMIMIGFSATLGAQSLVVLARVEKARRESLGNRRGPVVTNADLLRVKLRPAVEVVVPEEEMGELGDGTETGEGLPAEAGAVGSDVATPPAGETAAAPAEPGPEAADDEPTLQVRLKTAEELTELLKTKIAALNQDYSYQTSMVPNYVIEQQLTETLQRLQTAQAEVIRLKREIARVEREKKLAANPIR